MVAKEGISVYQNVQYQTADPMKLIIMLYQKLDSELHRAKQLLEEGDMLGKGEAIIRSQDIIVELINSLNLEAGEIAKNLQGLYLFLFRELNVINLRKDVHSLEKVIRIVENLKSAWEEIAGSAPRVHPRMASQNQPVNTVYVQG